MTAWIQKRGSRIPEPAPPRFPAGRIGCFLLMAAAAMAALCGCGQTRENAKAATMADQSLQAAQEQLEQDPPPAADPAALRAWLSRAYDRIVTTRRLLAPVIARLAVGNTAAELATGTSVEQASEDPAAFDAAAMAQIPKAQQEVDAAGFWDRLGVVARGVLKTALESSLGLALGGSGIGAGAIALGLKAVRVYRQAKAIGDEAIAYGNEATDVLKTVATPEAAAALAKVQRDAVERQARRGVWKQIDAKAKAKRAKPAPPDDEVETALSTGGGV